MKITGKREAVKASLFLACTKINSNISIHIDTILTEERSKDANNIPQIRNFVKGVNNYLDNYILGGIIKLNTNEI